MPVNHQNDTQNQLSHSRLSRNRSNDSHNSRRSPNGRGRAPNFVLEAAMAVDRILHMVQREVRDLGEFYFLTFSNI